MRVNKRISLPLVLTMFLIGLSACGQAKEEAPAPAKAATGPEFRQEIQLQEALPRIAAGQAVKVAASVRNTSNFTWQAFNDPSVRLTYHWLDKAGKIVVYDGERSFFAKDLPAGETTTFVATIKAPPAAGEYTLQLTMVQEGIAWFIDKGAQPLEIPVKVESK